jgi:hypothetical protein
MLRRGSQPVELEPDQRCADYNSSDIASLEDPALEAVVRTALGDNGSDALRCFDLTGVTWLQGESAGITQLGGIQPVVA